MTTEYSEPIWDNPELEPSSKALALQPVAITEIEQRQATVKQESYQDLMALAKELVTTGFLPAAVKTPAQAVAIILTGRELGLPPMQALRSICIIQGKPELAADLQLSLFKRAGGQAKWLSQTSIEAQLWLIHPNGDEFTQIFTIEDAKRAGLAGGVNWQKYPQAMLRSRAITAGLKSVGFEPLCGCYAPGEIGGVETVEHHDTDPSQHHRLPVTPQQPTLPPQQALKPAKVVFATVEQHEKMVAALVEFQPHATEYFVKLGKLMPNESISELPLRFVPATVPQWEALKAAIKSFTEGSPLREAFPPNPEPNTITPAPVIVAGAPRAASPTHSLPEAPRTSDLIEEWRTFPMPWGKQAGVPLKDLEKNYLFGLWANYEVKTEYNGKPKKPATIAKDTKFREMLDAAGQHYEFVKKD